MRNAETSVVITDVMPGAISLVEMLLTMRPGMSADSQMRMTVRPLPLSPVTVSDQVQEKVFPATVRVSLAV